MITDITELKKRVFYLAAILSILGHGIDVFFLEDRLLVSTLNLSTIVLTIFTVLLFKNRYIGVNLANAIIIYSVFINSLVSLVIKTTPSQIESHFFEPALLFGIIILYTGFVLKRIHTYIVGSLFIIYYIFISFYSSGNIMINKMPIIIIIQLCYVVGVLTIVRILDNYHTSRNELINDLKRRNELLRTQSNELSALNETKDKLFSIIGHDLKSPASTIMGFAELISLKAKEVESDSLKAYSYHIYQASNSLNMLLAQLLDWSRIQTGKLTVNKSIIDVNRIILDIVELMRGTVYLKNINVYYPDDAKQEVLADKQMISTVVRNLLMNALKYTPENGTINISSKIKDDKYIFTIKDSGIGMDADTLAHIFSDKTVKSKPGTNNEKGTGLGLYVCKEYILNHSGKIWAESEPDKGATFSFYIPVS